MGRAGGKTQRITLSMEEAVTSSSGPTAPKHGSLQGDEALSHGLASEEMLATTS